MRYLYFTIILLLSISIYSQVDIAIKGYDTVAYFTESKAVKGSDKIYTDWSDQRWFFDSEKNRNLFLESPELYIPYFGEYCANGLSDGHVIAANPKYWLIDKGRLFLFYSRSGRNSWINGDLEAEFIKAVDYLESISR